jgi:hypothetical protein
MNSVPGELCGIWKTRYDSASVLPAFCAFPKKLLHLFTSVCETSEVMSYKNVYWYRSATTYYDAIATDVITVWSDYGF